VGTEESLSFASLGNSGPDVAIVGHAVVDRVVKARDEEVSKLGLPLGGYVVVEEEAEWRALEPLLKTAAVTPGGSAPNTAAALVRLGVRVALFAKVGRDPEGKLFLSSLQSPLLRVLPPTVSFSAVTQSVLILSGDNERTIVANRTRPVATLDVADLDASIIQRASITMLPAFHLNRPNGYDLSMHAITLARNAGQEVVLSLSGPRISVDHQRVIRDWLEEGIINLCFGNEAEVERLAGVSDSHQAQIDLAQGGATVVVTLASKGARLVSRGQTITVPAPATSPVDVTGAGDGFAAGFLFAKLRGWDLRSCLKAGNSIAGQVIRFLGARPPLMFPPPQLAIEGISGPEIGR
jgi:sugar/nucleoside kinase (ribokinase family)